MSASNICHCCLAQGTLKDTLTEYCHDGQKEVYSEMLLNTLNITILQNSQCVKICEQCIVNLRKATEFKKNILNSQRYLTTLQSFDTNSQLGSLSQDPDDFDDEISVSFDEDDETLSSADLWNCKTKAGEKGEIFVIKLLSKKDYSEGDCSKSPKLDSNQETQGECTQKYRENWDNDQEPAVDLMEIQPKTKQQESKTHKDLKQNSLKLVFNSNLCLFKSLKTKFGCFNCNEAFFTVNELRRHSKMHSNFDAIEAKFNRLRGLSYQNADISSLKCTNCSQACLDLTDLEKHLRKQHGVEFGDAGHFLIPYKLENSFDCVVCNEKFNTYMSLSVHMNQHYSNNVCEICGNSYINRISLRIHLQTRHREKKCSLCSETFLTNYARVRHMRARHNSCLSKRYCLICGKTFRYTYQLIEHKIQEHGFKRQLSKCSLCAKTFPNTQNLKIHIRSVHVKERNFPCNLCEMRFFTKFDQKRHEKTHVDIRSFACIYCESKFKGKDSLRRHLKRQHGHTST